LPKGFLLSVLPELGAFKPAWRGQATDWGGAALVVCSVGNPTKTSFTVCVAVQRFRHVSIQDAY
jgi:hypothetical protein